SFLDGSSHQLTYHGLTSLHSHLSENSLAVFFRNNHFSTLFKHEGTLFLLVTDQGYATVGEIVWEALSNIDGDTAHVNGEFQTPSIADDYTYSNSNLNNTHASADDALQAAIAASLQPQDNPSAAAAAPSIATYGPGHSETVVAMPPNVAVEMKRAVELFVTGGDSVFELGAQLQGTSLAIAEAAEHLQSAPPFNVIVCDIQAMTGNDLPTQMETISTVRDLLALPETPPTTVIIKSAALNTLAWRLVHSQRLFDGTDSLPLEDGGFPPTEPIKDRPPMPSLNGLPPIVATVGVENYRRAIPYTVRTGDAVLEVGCHAGTTTTLLTKAAGEGGGAIGVDIGPSILEQAKKNYPETMFSVGDAWRTAELARICDRLFPPPSNSHPSSRAGYDVIYVDVGGLSGADGLLDSLSLLDGLSFALEPRVIVIKSLCIRRLASSLRPFAKIWWKRKL
ncbi:hypothetical protein TrRE_jg12866, partial [Triparma retinervis]